MNSFEHNNYFDRNIACFFFFCKNNDTVNISQVTNVYGTRDNNIGSIEVNSVKHYIVIRLLQATIKQNRVLVVMFISVMQTMGLVTLLNWSILITNIVCIKGQHLHSI